jgi:CheY-like chemotaxis protein
MTKQTKNILVVDDSLFFRTKFSDILSEAGHRVSLATDGMQAIAMLKKNPSNIDLLTLDLHMPQIDGLGVLEWMKGNACSGKFPVLMLTNVQEEDEVLERLKSLGANGFLSKACSHDEILSSVNQMLFVNTRKEPRVPVRLMVDYELGDMTYTGTVHDMSTTGLLLHARIDIPPGTELRLKFSLPGSGGVFDVKGIVRWSSTSEQYQKLSDGVGIMFASISDDEKEEIGRFVEKQRKKLKLDLQADRLNPPLTDKSV